MFGSHPLELLVVGIVALLLFGKRLPTVAQRHRMFFSDQRSEQNEIALLKVAIVVFVAGLWYFVLNSR